MRNFLEKLDSLADIKTENNLIRLFDRAAFVFMILMIVCAPHSIAATQIAWLTGMFIWVLRIVFIKPRPRLVRTPLDIPLWAFLIWSIITSIFSYDPPTSIDKLRNVLLFLIFYFVVNVVKTKRAAVFLAFAMLFSQMVSVAWTPIERIFGRGVEVSGVSPNSPLAKMTIKDGDTLLKADGKTLKTPEEFLAAIETNGAANIYFYRPDYYLTVEIKRENLLPGATAAEKLGFTDWKRSRNWRSTGFYSHYTTFAEVLQLIASLTFGLFIALFSKRFARAKEIRENWTQKEKRWLLILAACLVGMCFALLLTVTRASQLGFLISSAAIVLTVGNRKIMLLLAAVILPVALGGLFFLQQSREVGFFDSQDDSIRWRQTVWREGFNLWKENPRHLLLGVGMDSIKKYAAEWHLFDDGKLPMGHFHSTPLQLLVERGLPALLLWLWVLFVYARVLLVNLNVQNPDDESSWKRKGIMLGSFGGLIGFVAGGFVHYNLGDAEVAMVFFMLMGISVSITNFKLRITNDKENFNS